MAEKKEKESKQTQGIKLDWGHKKPTKINEYKQKEEKKK